MRFSPGSTQLGQGAGGCLDLAKSDALDDCLHQARLKPKADNGKRMHRGKL